MILEIVLAIVVASLSVAVVILERRSKPGKLKWHQKNFQRKNPEV